MRSAEGRGRTLEEAVDAALIELGETRRNVDVKVDLGSITVEAMQSITFKVGGNSITLDQTGVTVKGIMISIEGQALTQVKAPMTSVNGDGMLTLKGGITMIN